MCELAKKLLTEKLVECADKIDRRRVMMLAGIVELPVS